MRKSNLLLDLTVTTTGAETVELKDLNGRGIKEIIGAYDQYAISFCSAMFNGSLTGTLIGGGIARSADATVVLASSTLAGSIGQFNADGLTANAISWDETNEKLNATGSEGNTLTWAVGIKLNVL